MLPITALRLYFYILILFQSISETKKWWKAALQCLNLESWQSYSEKSIPIDQKIDQATFIDKLHFAIILVVQYAI